MRKILSLVVLVGLLVSNFNFLNALEPINPTINPISPISNISVDILKDGITANNAGLILQEKTFTTGNLDISNLKFTIVNGAKLSLDSNIRNSFEVATKTRSKFNVAKSNPSFGATSKIEDKIIEYPDRVRIIAKTEYSYNNKAEYDAIFSGSTDSQVISSKQVADFIAKNPDYNKYSSGIPKLNKKELLEGLTEKVYSECLLKNRNNSTSCKKTSIKNNVENYLNNYKGKRTLTETIDVNKIPLIYDADKNIDFVERLKNSNISKNPNEVRLSSLQIKNAFAQYTTLNSSNSNLPLIQGVSNEVKARNCDGLTGKSLTNCNEELVKLDANNAGTNTTIASSGTLLNGFTLGESYSYTLGDSYSVLGYTVYDIGVSFYAGYGVGIRIPIDYKVELNKDRLEKGVQENYSVKLDIDTVDKNKTWFVGALGSNKAFDGKEAVLEAGAYAKGKIILFEKTVFNEQIGGKADWGSNRKMPFGDESRLKIFEGEVPGNEIGLELVLYGIHISGDLKAEGYINGDISYECRSLSSEATTGDSIYCKDLMNTKLKDSDVADIKINSNSKTSTLNLKGNGDKFYYKNDLGVYGKYGVSLGNFKYKPDLEVDLSLRGKVGVDTGDYFGWFWLTTPRLKVYTFELDLPTLKAHDGYNPKKIDLYDNNFFYNFSKTSQDTNNTIDSSTSCKNYSFATETNYYIGKERFKTPDPTSYTFLPTQYKNYYNYNYGGNLFYKNDGSLVAQKNFEFGDASSPYKHYYHITSSQSGSNINYKYGYTRAVDYQSGKNVLLEDYNSNKISEMQFVNNNTLYYYSQSENALYTGDIKNRIIAYNPVPKIKSDTKYTALSTNKKPKKNTFHDVIGDEEDEENITNFSASYKFKKFNFAFSSDFANNKLFAYIAENKDTKKPSIQIYKNKSFYKEISEDDLEYNSINPVYIELVGNDLIIISEDINNTTGIKTYTIFEYNYEDLENPFVLESSLEKKKIEVSKDDVITSFAYDKANKTLFVSYFTLPLNSDQFSSKIKAIRFNGNVNTPFEKDIYSVSTTKEEIQNKYSDYLGSDLVDIPTGQKAKTYITNIQLGKNPHSLIISLDNSFSYQSNLSNNYFYFVVSEAKELNFNTSEGQKDNEGNCVSSSTPPPAPTTMNIGPNTNNSNLFSQDEYVNEKLKEINDCFTESYSGQLTNINSAIEKLQKELEKQTDENAKVKYTRAIAKMEEIKNLFMARYKTILDLNK